MHVSRSMLRRRRRKKMHVGATFHPLCHLTSPFPKVARIRPPPPDNTSLSACGPPHFPSVLTAPRLTQLPPPARAHTHTRRSFQPAIYLCATHTHTVSTQSSPLPIKPSIHHSRMHPSIPPSCSVCWCDNSWLIHLWFPSSSVPNTHTHTQTQACTRTNTHEPLGLICHDYIELIPWFAPFCCNLWGEERKRKKEKEVGEKGLIKSFSADVSLWKQTKKKNRKKTADLTEQMRVEISWRVLNPTEHRATKTDGGKKIEEAERRNSGGGEVALGLLWRDERVLQNTCRKEIRTDKDRSQPSEWARTHKAELARAILEPSWLR